MFELIKIFLLYLNILNFLFCFPSGIINLPFKKRNTDLSKFSPENIIYKGLQYNTIITDIRIGTKPQIIPMIIDLYHYDFFISGETDNDNNKNTILFNQSNSITFTNFGKFGDFGGRGFTIGYKSSDFYYLNDNEEKKYNISFILALDPDDGISGMIGLKLSVEEDKEILEYNFIKQLKKVNAINDYYFTIKYINYTDGNLIIGDLPENYDESFKNIEYKETYVINPNSPSSWNIQFDSIYTKFKNNDEITDLGNANAYFRIELGITIGNEEYRKELLNNFMYEEINKGNCMEKFVSYYYIYYCNSTVDFSKMKNLYFYNKELNYSFEFTYKDLFFYNELDDKYYFLIEFEKNTGRNRWLIGEFFFKKYQLIFNQEKKKIGIYTGRKLINDSEEDIKMSWLDKNKWYLLLMIFLIILLIALAILIYYIIKNKPRRKIKANELADEDYDYTINNDKIS